MSSGGFFMFLATHLGWVTTTFPEVSHRFLSSFQTSNFIRTAKHRTARHSTWHPFPQAPQPPFFQPNSSILVAFRMPFPPPPSEAFTIKGKPMLSARATASSTVVTIALLKISSKSIQGRARKIYRLLYMGQKVPQTPSWFKELVAKLWV